MRIWRLTLVLLALLATGAQQLVAQSHWHTAAFVDQEHSQSDNCLWCKVATHAAAAAPPGEQVKLQLTADAGELRVVVVGDLVAIQPPAHAWQSRGPPTV